VEVTFNAPTVELGPFRTQYGGNSTVKLAEDPEDLFLFSKDEISDQYGWVREH
jgi:hypothetical protein